MPSFFRRFMKKSKPPSQSEDTDSSPYQYPDPSPPPFKPMLDFIDKYKIDSLTAESSVGGGEEVRPGVMQMPYVILNTAQDAFRDAACQWTTEFDWIDWAEQGKGAGAGAGMMAGEPGSIEKASVEDIQKLLTAKIRGDRFCEGAFAAFCETGGAGRVLKRIQVLHAQKGAA